VTIVQAYARFMVFFFIAVGLGCLIKPLTDAPGGGLILWPEAGRTFGVFLINWVHTVLHLGLAVYAAFALSSMSRSRGFSRAVFWVCLVLVLIGLFTPDGVWLVPSNWPDDVAVQRITPVATASWYLFIPANPPDDALNALVGLSGFVFGYMPIGLRAWGYWRTEPATA
jgi:Domain of unknown function (DUF4383)